MQAFRGLAVSVKIFANKIMFWNRAYLLLAIVMVFIASTISTGFFLYKEYRLYNIYGATAGSRANLIKYNLLSLKENTKNYFVGSKKSGFDIVNLLIPEQTIVNLTSDFPINIKKYRPAFYTYPDGSVRKIDLKYKSDNPKNWRYQKKDMRIKLSKKRLIDNKRIFNYQQPDEEFVFSTFISYYLAKKAGILTPDADIVEKSINGKNQGIFFQYSHLDEIFLRRNMKMPVNIYKGEQYYTERSLDRSVYLFNNPGLWTKTAVFNQRADKDLSDLENFLRLLRLSETSNEHFEQLKIVASIEDWAKFAAYQTLLQSFHNDEAHNMRIISDLWSGNIIPVAYDTGSHFDSYFNENIVLDYSTHSLFKLYNRSSSFLSLKYKFLNKFIEDEILIDGANYLEGLLPNFLNAWSRDPSRAQTTMMHVNQQWDGSLDSMELKANKFIHHMRLRHSILNAVLQETPEANWFSEQKTFSLTLNSSTPIVDLTLIRDSNDLTQYQVFFDKDNNGIISLGDLFIPSVNDGNKIILSAEFLSNRVKTRNSFNEYALEKTVATQFNLIFDQPINLIKVQARQFFTNEVFDIQSNPKSGNTPGKLNSPITKKNLPLKRWSGTKEIQGIQEINNPIEILPGTKILMEENSSLIFKNKVLVSGTKDEPVSFFPKTEGEIWGTIALQGKNTRGSKFMNFSISGGSGYESANNKYTGMFSIHDTESITIEGMTLKDNSIFDDTLHFVYVSDVTLADCYIDNAFSDAIDIDISSVSIRGCNINNSSNDGIDSMSSKIIIKDTIITNSGDKGVSVGENSEVLIISSNLEKNNIGIEAKDSSLSIVYLSKLLKNNIQLNAYDKNWQYSKGGEHIVYETEITPLKNKIKNDKKSATYFLGERYNSKMAGKTKNSYFIGRDQAVIDGNNISINTLNLALNSWNEPLVNIEKID
jgi:hypothetical protein